MKTRAANLTLAALTLVPCVARAQAAIPVVDLPPGRAVGTQALRSVLSVRESSPGTVLVSDGVNRQLFLTDTTLARWTLAAEVSNGADGRYYGDRGTPLIPYFGDSSLFADFSSNMLLVLDATGRIGRRMPPPSLTSFAAIHQSAAAVDHRGRMLYQGFPPASEPSTDAHRSDFMVLLRADVEARTMDTLARIRVRDGSIGTSDRTNPARMTSVNSANPLPVLDDWAVTSDGSVAFIRGRDYHIDWIRPDLKMASSAKMPFDWIRVTDAEKRRLIDSTHAALETRYGGFNEPLNNAARAGAAGRANAPSTARFVVVDVPVSDLPDNYPAIRPGSTMPDRDNNLWILPIRWTPPADSALVYDVVNVKGELFERVRVPAGKRIAGFGEGGVVYLVSGDKTWVYLERTRLLGGAAKAR